MSTLHLPPLPPQFTYRLDLAKQVTPRLLKQRPLHNWFYFPHSFSPQLVEFLLEEWDIKPNDIVLDPFVGAGTTLCTARARGIESIGADISPLAVFVTKAKTTTYQPHSLRTSLKTLKCSFQNEDFSTLDTQRSERLKKAFNDDEYQTLFGLRQLLQKLTEPDKHLLTLALLKVQQHISRAVPDGGWFRWIERPTQAHKIWGLFEDVSLSMIEEVQSLPVLHTNATVVKHDARALHTIPDLNRGKKCKAVITSPPYPNRHDYSRIFQIELLTLGLDEQDIFQLRYNSLRSNVEARSPAKPLPVSEPPQRLKAVLSQLPNDADPRIHPMLSGYFEDMHVVLHSLREVLERGGHVALIIGNVRHAGVMVPVDEILVELAENLGYRHCGSYVARLRGNSAQQMGKFGREPARETILVLQLDSGAFWSSHG